MSKKKKAPKGRKPLPFKTAQVRYPVPARKEVYEFIQLVYKRLLG